MVGTRQHILPKFLLKGFASPITRNGTFTYVFRKDGTVFEASLDNIAVERYFYGRENDASADDEITRLESEYARLLDGLRTMQHGTEVVADTVGKFVAHLTIRTKPFRNSVRESCEFLFDEASTYLMNIHNFKRMMLSHPDLMLEEVERIIESRNLSRGKAKAFRHRAKEQLPLLINEHGPSLQTMFLSFVSQAKAELPTIFKQIHISALKRHPAPESRAKHYDNFRWFVFEFDDHLILGDHGCFFEAGGGKGFKAYDDKEDLILNVYLPISDAKMLVGTSAAAMPKADLSIIRQSIARCSRDFFVCSESDEGIQALVSLIGERAGLIAKEEMEQIITTVIRATE